MALRLGLKAWIAAGVMVGGLAAPYFTDADDTKAAAKPGVEAKAAFARLKTLAGDWKAQTSDDVAAGLAPMPERPPRRAVGRYPHRGDHLPGVRRAFRTPQRRIVLLQFLRRVPGLPGPRGAVRGR